MKKKIVALLLIMSLFLSIGSYSNANTKNDIFVFSLNGNVLNITNKYGKPFILNGTVMVPLKALAEAFGLKTYYNKKDKAYNVPVPHFNAEIIYRLDDQLVQVISQNDTDPTYKTNGFSMAEKPLIKNNNIYVPLTSMTRILGYKAQYKKEKNTHYIDLKDYYPKTLRGFSCDDWEFIFKVNEKILDIPSQYGFPYLTVSGKLMLPAEPFLKEFGFEIKAVNKSSILLTDIEYNGRYNRTYTLSDEYTFINPEGKKITRRYWEIPSTTYFGRFDQEEVFIDGDTVYLSLGALESIINEKMYILHGFDNTKLLVCGKREIKTSENSSAYLVAMTDPLKSKRLSNDKAFLDFISKIPDTHLSSVKLGGIERPDIEAFSYYNKSKAEPGIAYTDHSTESSILTRSLELYFMDELNDKNREILKRILMATTDDWKVIYDKYIELYTFYRSNGGNSLLTANSQGKSAEWKKKDDEYRAYMEYWHRSGNTIFKISDINIEYR